MNNLNAFSHSTVVERKGAKITPLRRKTCFLQRLELTVVELLISHVNWLFCGKNIFLGWIEFSWEDYWKKLWLWHIKLLLFYYSCCPVKYLTEITVSAWFIKKKKNKALINGLVTTAPTGGFGMSLGEKWVMLYKGILKIVDRSNSL